MSSSQEVGAGPRAAHEPGLSGKWIIGIILLPVAIGLVAFFGFQTLYRLWCRQTGTSLNPNDPAVAAMLGTHTGRFVTVWFASRVDDGLPVDFGPAEPSKRVEVGIDGRTSYRISNRSDHVLRMRPIHYIAPINASTAFGMKVCFCFNDLTLAPHESRTYPVIFAFSPKLDQRIRAVTICYTLFTLDSGEDDVQLNRRIDKTVQGLGGVVSPRHAPAGESAPAPVPSRAERP